MSSEVKGLGEWASILALHGEPWEGEIGDLVRRMVERVSYDGTTGGVSLRLATIDS